MPDVRYPLFLKATRAIPPRADDRDDSTTLPGDAAVVLTMDLEHGRIRRMEVHGFDGREGREEDATAPNVLPEELVFRSWLGMARCIAKGEGFPDSVRAFCEAVAEGAEQIADRIASALDLDTKPTETFPGAPSWVHRAGDTIGVEVCDAWSEALGFDLRARIEAMPLGLQIEWQAYLASFQMRLGDVMRRKLARPTKSMMSPRLANEIAGIVLHEIRRDQDMRKHPRIEAPT